MNESNLNDRLLLRPSEAAEQLAICQRLLWKHTKNGDIPCIRLGKAVRYDPADLQNWINRRKQQN